MFVGEQPGNREDLEGKPVTRQCGEMMKITAATTLSFFDLALAPRRIATR
jgi:uracil-DNA glycosylase